MWHINKELGKRIKKANFWLRRKSFLPMLVIGSLVVLILFFNEDASVSLNMEYDRQIHELTRQITECKDSANFFRTQREAILHENADLERIAREKFHMQRPEEDVYLLK